MGFGNILINTCTLSPPAPYAGKKAKGGCTMGYGAGYGGGCDGGGVGGPYFDGSFILFLILILLVFGSMKGGYGGYCGDKK